MGFLRYSCFYHAPGKRLIEGVPTVWRCQEAPGKHGAYGAGLSPDRLCPYNPVMAKRAGPLYQAHRSRNFGMKTRASNLMIGTTTLAVIAAAFVGHLGLQKIRSVQQRGPLRIIFEGSASGLHKGGSVNFDGVQVGEIMSLKLDNPRKVVAFVMLDNSAPIRKDTVVGLEFQGLTGLAAISLTGGAAAAPPVPLDADGVPTLAADLSETTSIRDTLHNVDRILVGNQAMLKDAMLSFETHTAMLAGKGDAIDSMMRKADSAFESIDSGIAKIDDVLPGFASGSSDELFQKVKSIRELAQSFNKRSGALMEEGRHTLLDISQAAVKVTRKFDPQAVSGDNPTPPRNPRQKRQ
jgi:phospholipid/cholesterol/gamma-HCH transport system substrate-binding protein